MRNFFASTMPPLQAHFAAHMRKLLQTPFIPPAEFVPNARFNNVILRGLLHANYGCSMLLHSKPGSGKTTAARFAIEQLRQSGQISGCLHLDLRRDFHLLTTSCKKSSVDIDIGKRRNINSDIIAARSTSTSTSISRLPSLSAGAPYTIIGHAERVINHPYTAGRSGINDILMAANGTGLAKVFGFPISSKPAVVLIDHWDEVARLHVEADAEKESINKMYDGSPAQLAIIDSLPGWQRLIVALSAESRIHRSFKAVLIANGESGDPKVAGVSLHDLHEIMYNLVQN